MAYAEQTKDIKKDIRVNKCHAPISLSSLSDGWAGSASAAAAAALGAPSHGQPPYKQVKASWFCYCKSTSSTNLCLCIISQNVTPVIFHLFKLS